MTTDTKSTDYATIFIVLALLMLACISPADAQYLPGSGGGGAGSGLVSWLLTILDVVFGIAIIFCGIMMMRGHGEWMLIGFVALGILIAEHWQDILSALKAGV